MRRVVYLMLVVWLAVARTDAHPALYHYLEINLHEPGKVLIFVTLHAPELSDDVAPLEEDVFGADWLATRSDEQIAELVANAHRFAGEKFAFMLGNAPEKMTWEFPEAETIRQPPSNSEVPAGCFSGVADLSYGTGGETLLLNFSPQAEKRLMLVINRPAAFPEVFDIEPGSQQQIALTPAPEMAAPDESKETESYYLVSLVTAVLLFPIVVAVVLLLRGKASRRDRSG